MMKEKAAAGDDLAKLMLERFGDEPDSLLLRFLRARKFDVVRAHDLMRGESQRRRPPVSRRSFVSIAAVVGRQTEICLITCEFVLVSVCSLWFRLCRYSPAASVIERESSFVLLVCVNPAHH